MKYSNNYMYSKDIDWFFSINNQFIHVASAGGLLPKQINDRDELRNIQKKVFELPYIHNQEEIELNQPFLIKRFNNNINGINNYLTSFVEMAMKGFISMDRTNLENLNDNRYHIVCMPKKLKPIEGLEEIFKIEHNEQISYSSIATDIDLLNLFKITKQ